MSFKYRFILSFVLLEVIFIVLIVASNFYTIKNTSDELIKEKIELNLIFLEELIKVPMSIFDLATLDNLVENTIKQVNTIIIIDKEDRILSSSYEYKHNSIDEIIKLKENKYIEFNEEHYSIKYKKIYQDNTYLGSMYIIFDLSTIHEFIKKNEERTFIIILLEILLSTVLSYIIGNNITKKLESLSNAAIKIGKEENTDIPYKESTNEIGILANAMHNMQSDLIKRSEIIKNSNDLLKKQKDDLILANQIKDDFLANMSHELKTPLNSINVISSVMKNNSGKNLSDKQIENLSVINNCGNKLLFLVNDVLELSRLETKKVELDFENIKIDNFIRNIYKIILPQTNKKNIKFNLNIKLTIEDYYSDSKILNQIITNILSNAVKFTNKGTIDFIISNNDNELVIVIQDTGIGIERAKIENIFDRFKQVDNSISRKFGGTGLGLAICKESVDLLKGSIYLNSELNKGTNFVVHLPLIYKESKKVTKELNSSQNFTKEKEEKNTGKNKTILILNNDPIYLFKIIIELGNRYELIQTDNIEDFIKINTSKNIYRAIISLKENGDSIIQKLSITKRSNYVVLYDDDNIKEILPPFIISKYKRENILKNLKQSKDIL